MLIRNLDPGEHCSSWIIEYKLHLRQYQKLLRNGCVAKTSVRGTETSAGLCSDIFTGALARTLVFGLLAVDVSSLISTIFRVLSRSSFHSLARVLVSKRYPYRRRSTCLQFAGSHSDSSCKGRSTKSRSELQCTGSMDRFQLHTESREGWLRHEQYGAFTHFEWLSQCSPAAWK